MSNRIGITPILTILLASMIAISSQYSEIFADHATALVSINPYSSVHGCEKTNNCFIPSIIIIKSGDRVTWSNYDSVAHTVTSGTRVDGSDGNFDSSLLMASTTFSHKFDDYESGTYPYFCMIHSWMTGEVIVQVGGEEHGDEAITRGGFHDPAKIYSSKVLGTEYSVDYRISSGQVTSAITNNDTNSIIIQLNQVKEGELTIILPRELIDAKIGTDDDSFFVVIDEEQVEYNEIPNPRERKLIIPFPDGAEVIEIIGTKIAVASTITATHQTPFSALPSKSSTGVPTPESSQTPPPAPYGTDVIIATNSSLPGCHESNDCFTPNQVTVDVSGEIIWYNGDTVAHTVTSGTLEAGPDGYFDSSLFMPGKTFSVKFEGYEPDTYPYLCLIHPWMRGQVMVVNSEDTKNNGNLYKSNESIMLWADKPAYEDGTTIKIEGKIIPDSSIINLKIYNPFKFNIVDEKIMVSENGNFEKEFDTSSYLWYQNGEYVIQVEDGNGNTNQIKVTVDEPKGEFIALAQESQIVPAVDSTNDNDKLADLTEENKKLGEDLERQETEIANLNKQVDYLTEIISSIRGFFGSIFS